MFETKTGNQNKIIKENKQSVYVFIYLSVYLISGHPTKHYRLLAHIKYLV